MREILFTKLRMPRTNFDRKNVLARKISPIGSSKHLRTDELVTESKFSTTQVLERFLTVRGQDNLARTQR